MYSANYYENWHNWAHSVVGTSHGSRFTVCMTKLRTTALRRLEQKERFQYGEIILMGSSQP